MRQAGGKVLVDAGSPREATERLIPLADIFSFPARFAQDLPGLNDAETACREILRRGARAAICTEGANGATAATMTECFHTPAFPVRVRDSTGAGDVFCGGLGYGLLQNRDLRRTVQFATATAAIKCQGSGIASHLRRWSRRCCSAAHRGEVLTMSVVTAFQAVSLRQP